MYNLRIFQHCVRTSLRSNADKKFVNHSILIQKYSTGKQICDDKDLTYVALDVGDHPEVMRLVKKFIPFSPICRGIGATYEDVKEIMDHITYYTLKHNMSYGIRDEGKLVGVATAKIQRDTDNTWDNVAKIAEGNKKAELLVKTRKDIANKYVLSKKLGVNEVLYSRTILHPDYHSVLYIMNLMNLVEQKGVQKGLKHIKAVCFSVQSKKAADRRGYKLVSQTQYKDFDYLDLTAIGESKAISVMVKKLP